MSKKLRRVFLTWNNWQDDFETKEDVKKYIEELPHLRGAVVGFEEGEEGTPHLQAVVAFTNGKTFTTLRKYFFKAHIEPVKSLKEAIVYCKKEGDYFEIGEILGSQGKRNDIHEFRDAIIAGYSNAELLDAFPAQYFRFGSQIEKVKQDIKEEYYSKQLRDVKVVYIAGRTGTGKTHFVYNKLDIEEIYRVNNYKNPFDYYQNQDILVLDEFDGSLLIRDMLNYIDKYPLQLPARYNNRWATYTKIIILSNLRFDEHYRYIDDETYEAWQRRFDAIHWVNTREEMEQVGEEVMNLFSQEK